MSVPRATLRPCNHTIIFSDLNGRLNCPGCHRRVEQIQLHHPRQVTMDRNDANSTWYKEVAELIDTHAHMIGFCKSSLY